MCLLREIDECRFPVRKREALEQRIINDVSCGFGELSQLIWCFQLAGEKIDAPFAFAKLREELGFPDASSAIQHEEFGSI